VDEIKYKRALIAIFINAIYLYDDKVTIFFNAVDRPTEFDYSVLAGKEKPPDNDGSGCSYMKESGVP